MKRSRTEKPSHKNTHHKTTGSRHRSKIEKRPSSKSHTQEKTLTTNHRYTYLTVSPETQDDDRFQPRFFRRLLPLALVLISCVKLIEFSPVLFFGCSSVSCSCSDSSRSVLWFSGTVCAVTLLSGLVIRVGRVSM